jgi:serine/threonine protein kinase
MTDRDNERDHGTSANGETVDETRFLDRESGEEKGVADYVEPHERIDSPAGARYLIGETLGEGGMAVVHRATDVQLRRSVAVKRLRPEYAARSDIRQTVTASTP